MDNELLPCPFCGSDNLIFDCHETGYGVNDWCVECQHCLADGPCADTREDAARLWNDRAPVARRVPQTWPLYPWNRPADEGRDHA